MSFTPSRFAGRAAQIDPVLLPVFQARDSQESARAVERLLTQFADPIIKATVERYVSGVPRFVLGEAAEVRAETFYRLMERLTPTSGSHSPIRDFRAYVKTTACHVCWNRRTAAQKQIPCAALFDDADTETTLTEAIHAPGDLQSDTEGCHALRATWNEIQLLPHAQRVALLLPCRVTDGRSGIVALLQEGHAPLSQVAAALGLTSEEAQSILSELPLDDAAIGVRLGRTAHQVNNLRVAARRRITRRLREWLN